MSTVESRLQALGLTLPPPPPPAGHYQSWKRHDKLIYVSGRGARDAAGRPMTGRVGADLTAAEAYQHARAAGLLILSIVRQAAGSLDGVEAVRLFGMVNAVPEFREHSRVLDGCSELFLAVLGERGRHARSAVGVSSLPNEMSVEIEAIFAIGHCSQSDDEDPARLRGGSSSP
jgi:enamine deaminase RidA (YjgF/YER057c/UK114 family)